MTKSKYAEQLSKGKPLLDEILDGQIGRLGRALPKDREDTLGDWVDLAEAESSVKDSYRGRYLFELIQNANDAIIDAQDKLDNISAEHHLVRLQLTDRSLLVANYGQPFGPDNVRALCRLHNTTKSVSKQIGHKGIGFKSVLEICEKPEVYSDIYAFGYDGGKFHLDVERVMGPGWDPGLRLPMLRAPYPCYINQLPEEDRKLIGWLFDEGYVTVIRLPLTERAIKEVADRMDMSGQGDIKPTLLLFMTAISQIELCFPDGKEIAYYRRVMQTSEPRMNRVHLHCHDATGGRIDSRWLVLGPIERELRDRSLITGLDKAWHDVNALRFSLAFPLAEDANSPFFSGPSQPFHVYFPTEEPSGLGFAVHADFHVGHDRKTLALNGLNRWLIEEICAYLASDGIELLKQYWPYSHQLVELLAPKSQPERPFGRAFVQTYLRYLSMTPFVPIEGRNYKTPEDSCLPPENVDQERFRQLFPAAKLRGSARWAYPIPEVVESERSRKLPFLLGPELSAKVVTPEMVVEALKPEGMPPVERSFELIEFLADWRDEMPGGFGSPRVGLERLLKGIPIFPTTNGWLQPGADKGIVFQANLRPSVDNIVPPPGFEFSVIIRSVYPDTGIHSNQYDLFRSLGAREYSARDIVRDAILPVLTNPERFESLLSKHPHSIYEAYELLKDYYLSDGTTVGFQDRLTRVPVPATDGAPDGWSDWKKAGGCYLGRDWPGGEVLKGIYAGFDDCFFLAGLEDLGLANARGDREEWAGFFCWLGVMNRPQVLSAPQAVHRFSKDPFESSLLWSEYLTDYDEGFRCTNPGRSHGLSRSLSPVHSIHHFADLVRENNAEKLLALYALIAQTWSSHYERHMQARLSCDRVTCPSDSIENYLLYELRNARWLPVQVGGEITSPLSPKEIWILGETDPTDVRTLVPTLPAELRTGAYKDLATDLGFISSSSAQVEDYLRLLLLLPDRLPLEVAGHTDEDRARWHRSVRAVFNWICERIQTGLVSRGDKEPQRPEGLQVLSFRGDEACYMPVGSPDLVYPDNSFLAERWVSHCAFLRIDDDWVRLRAWLGVPDLSTVVESQWSWEGELEKETRDLTVEFHDTLPYFLALIKHYQPARYDRLVPRLGRLRVHVVKNLLVEERMTCLPDVQPITSALKVHLEKTDDPNPRGGALVRGGDLFIHYDVVHNLDLLGDHIADYVEIARLGDAFVILINRSDKEGKQRFVRSKGVALETLQQVFADQESEYREATRPSSATRTTMSELIKKTIEQVEGSRTEPTPPAPAAQPDPQSQVPEAGGAKQTLPKAFPSGPQYPALVLDNLPGVTELIFTDGFRDQPPGPGGRAGGGGGGGGRGGRIPSQEITAELGRRGEEWAYENEKQRLRQLGYDPEEREKKEELSWVSRTQPTANHDIRSIRVTEEGEERPVYIEVKSSVGDSRDIVMSMAEFKLALSVKEDYWLYWVAHVDAAQPNTPICYPNLARLIEENGIDLSVDTIVMTLPRPVETSRLTDHANAG